VIPDRLLPTTATWLRPGAATDAYGNLTPDWGSATATAIRCRVQQATSDERADETRDALVRTWRMWSNETSIRGRDRVTVDGAVFEVDGPPALVFDGVGPHHLEATLRRVEG